MMIPLNKISCILLLTLQIGSWSVAEAYYDTVNVKIMNGDEMIVLNWKRTGQHVANKNMPVWLAEKNKEPRFAPQIMEQMSDFITYHDVEKSSAAVYVTQCNCFYGIIDTRFFIYRLPLNCLEPDIHYRVGDEYIIIRNQDGNGRLFHNAHGEWIRNFFVDDEIQFINELIDRDNSIPHSKPLPLQLCPAQRDHNMVSSSAEVIETPRPPTKVLYPEFLVFIAYDVYRMFKNPLMGDHYNLLVAYYVLYFNAIDMLFAKLATDDVAIRINIAGLVVETEFGAFPHDLHQCVMPKRRNDLNYLNADALFSNFPKYINQHKNIFVEDSFDFFFIATRFQLRENGEIFPAKSTPLIDVFARRIVTRVDGNMMGLIVQQEGAQGDYVIAARQMALLMNILPNKMEQQSNNNAVQCTTIMQSGWTHCYNCLIWTAENQNQLRNFVRSNLNHCFLLNYPRSLYPYGQPVFSLNPEDQCMCYNYPKDTLNPFYMLSIPLDSCGKQIECTYLEYYGLALPMPVDGTPCGSNNKVCWRQKCVDLTQQSDSIK